MISILEIYMWKVSLKLYSKIILSSYEQTTFSRIAILLSVAVVTSIDLNQNADAAKAEGTTTQKCGYTTKSLVCGDRLCFKIQ